MKFLIFIAVIVCSIQATFVLGDTVCQIRHGKESIAKKNTAGNIISDCDTEGNFKELQCPEGTTNRELCECWDKEGKKVTNFLFPLQQCTCIIKRNEASKKPDSHQPICEQDGTFKKEQCHQGKCWCVDEKGKELTEKKAGSGFCK